MTARVLMPALRVGAQHSDANRYLSSVVCRLCSLLVRRAAVIVAAFLSVRCCTPRAKEFDERRERSMRRWLLLCALLSTAVQAGTLHLRDAYIRELPPGQTVSAGYFTLLNTGKAPVALVAGTSDAADRVEIHAHRMSGGAMHMEQLHRVEVPAGGQVQFKPGGLHLMLIDLKRPLHAGDTVTVMLLDEKGGGHRIQLPVIDARAAEIPATHESHQH